MSITPYLLYEDVSGALKFLSKAFGFRKHGRPMVGPDGKLNHAAMKLGDDFIMRGCPGSKYKNPKRLGQATQSLYVNIDNVDKHFAPLGKQEQPSWRNLKISSMITVATARRTRKVISGTSLKRSRNTQLRSALLDNRANDSMTCTRARFAATD